MYVFDKESCACVKRWVYQQGLQMTVEDLTAVRVVQ